MDLTSACCSVIFTCLLSAVCSSEFNWFFVFYTVTTHWQHTAIHCNYTLTTHWGGRDGSVGCLCYDRKVGASPTVRYPRVRYRLYTLLPGRWTGGCSLLHWLNVLNAADSFPTGLTAARCHCEQDTNVWNKLHICADVRSVLYLLWRVPHGGVDVREGGGGFRKLLKQSRGLVLSRSYFF